MASHPPRYEVTDPHVAVEMDYPQHEKTYESFLRLLKWGAIGSVLAVIVWFVLYL